MGTSLETAQVQDPRGFSLRVSLFFNSIKVISKELILNSVKHFETCYYQLPFLGVFYFPKF